MQKYRIMIDGQEFISAEGDDAPEMFEQTVNDPETRNLTGRTEYALLVWKPRYGIWLREKLMDLGAHPVPAA